jgi:hypothetical protein
MLRGRWLFLWQVRPTVMCEVLWRDFFFPRGFSDFLGHYVLQMATKLSFSENFVFKEVEKCQKLVFSENFEFSENEFSDFSKPHFS